MDEEGFSPTGDIMEERAPGVMYWCDRVKNILKLAQGEFVSLWRLEAFFSGSPLIYQVCSARSPPLKPASSWRRVC